MSDTRRENFITAIIDEDLQSGRHDHVVTRFPPEPNGYLHIGHAKSICLNFGLAAQYDGRCHLRFDDTNPTKEETEYVESIQADVRWLGFDWGEHLYFASDYFERMYELAEHLIQKGKAYVDSADRETVREYRGTLTEHGRPTPDRDRPVAENLDLFRRMRAGEFADGELVLRAKIDLANPNMLMRDPVLYRIQNAHHHRTGDAWCIYPMYDYAHGLEDAFEGVTHSICTLEFENNRELYDWVIEETEVEWRPRQYEFARLSLEYWIMSKRKFLQLVNEEHVRGWDDPRMPTIAGLRRRGVRPEAIRRFADLVGVAKANSTVEMELLEFAIRDDLNMVAPRVMCVTDPLELVIDNWPEGAVDWLDASYYPHDVPLEGERKVPFDGVLYIERDDFMVEPPKGFYRLAPGVEVRLRYGYYVTCRSYELGADGEIARIHCTYDPQTRGGSSPDGRKVKGTIHWVSAANSLPCELRIYDRLFSVPDPEADPHTSYLDYLNPESLVVREGRVEPTVKSDDPATRYQFERRGYFWQDPDDSTPDALVFNRIVALRDSWQKQKPAREDADTIRSIPAIVMETARTQESDRPQKRSAAYERDKAREANPALAARYASYGDELGLDEDEADLLTGDVALGDFFEEAVAIYDAPYALSKWIANTLLPQLGDEPDLTRVDPTHVASLVRLVDDDRITAAVSGDVLTEVLASGASPQDVVAARGLEKVSDTSELEPLIDEVMAQNPEELARYRDGKTSLLGFFIGKVMQASGGTADAQIVREMLQDRL